MARVARPTPPTVTLALISGPFILPYSSPQVADLSYALDWVVQHIHLFGGDPRRISLVGHSAGGHLGMWGLSLPSSSARLLALWGCLALMAAV